MRKTRKAGTASFSRIVGSVARTTCVSVAVFAFFALGLSGCSSDDDASSASTLTTGGGRPTEVSVDVGEEVELGEVKVRITALYQTASPLLPPYPISAGPRLGLGEGEVFYQALARIDNRGSGAVRADPYHFTLIAGSAGHSIDPTRSGPIARTLLPGASFDFVLTYRGQEVPEPELLYSPRWFNGTVLFRGMLSPAGVVGAR